MNGNFGSVRTIFIGGCPRSGTTMLGAILGSTSSCVVTPESHFKQTIPIGLGVDWTSGMRRDILFPALSENFRFKLWGINPSDLDLPENLLKSHYRQIILGLVDRYIKITSDKNWNCWVDHTPQNIQDPLMLMSIFPGTKFIHIVRDPRAVAASVLPLNWGPNDPENAAIFWAQKMSYGLALEKMHPDSCTRVYYEDILAKPSETVREICKYCEIEFQESMLTGSQIALPNYTKNQHVLVGSLPDKSKIKSWKKKLSEWQIFAIEQKLGDLMELVGYSKEIVGKRPKQTRRDKVQSILCPAISIIKDRKHRSKKRKYAKL